MKKGQNWSIEAMISITVFMVIVIVALVFVNYLPKSNSKELVTSSNEVMVKIDSDLDLINDYDIDMTQVIELEEYSSEELGEALGVEGDVCISFQTLDGKIIQMPNSKKGIGVNENNICGK